MLFSKDTALAISGSSSDDPTVVGATLRVHTAAGCGGPCDATYALPADGWRRLGAPGEIKGLSLRRPAARVWPREDAAGEAGQGAEDTPAGEHSSRTRLRRRPAPVDVVLTLGTQRVCLRAGGTTRFTPGRKYSASDRQPPRRVRSRRTAARGLMRASAGPRRARARPRCGPGGPVSPCTTAMSGYDA